MTAASKEGFVALGVYGAYPHTNGFLPGGERMVVGSAGLDALLIVDVAIGATPRPLLELAEIGSAPGAIPWFDVALEVPLLATVWAGRILTLDLSDAAPRPRAVRTAAEGAAFDGLVSISPDGSRIAAIEVRGDSRTLLSIDARSGSVESSTALHGEANHVQISPADPAWVGFAHEGPAASIPDRMWGVHPRLAPQGISLFDQRALSADHDDPLQAGHERWMFHRPGAIIVAYGEGPAPRGVWEVPVGAEARLISAGDRDWHCGISRDGTRVVVDTTGPAAAPGRGWADAGDRSSIVVIDTATGARTVIAETRFAPHPFHPHPAFTPDGAQIVHNHIDPQGRRGVALREAAQ
ncbi:MULTISPECIES: hypothetical protein [unclassified Microbacterium]|uniref:hypothetical protein n=1 Tax=unclassified Microbacterium TaxID=2609290 RepID=UPI0012F9A72A|nr:hypothetical protein [Microbacterium sp. MAH-37]MVQ44091.1 hypothetical protein [Microbacterium sp. MAH-37]